MNRTLNSVSRSYGKKAIDGIRLYLPATGERTISGPKRSDPVRALDLRGSPSAGATGGAAASLIPFPTRCRGAV